MSVRHALLALLSEGPKYGLQLRQEFEARTGRCGRSTSGRCTRPCSASSATGWSSPTTPTTTARRRASGSPPAGADELADWLRTPPDGGAAARRAGHQGAGRGPPCPGVDVHERDPGPPPPPGRADAALHPGQGRRRRATTWPGPGRRRRAVPARGGRALARRGRRPAQAQPPGGQPRRRLPRRAGAGDRTPDWRSGDDRHARAAPGVEGLRDGADRGARPARGRPDGRAPASWWRSWGRAGRARARC